MCKPIVHCWTPSELTSNINWTCSICSQYEHWTIRTRSDPKRTCSAHHSTIFGMVKVIPSIFGTVQFSITVTPSCCLSSVGPSVHLHSDHLERTPRRHVHARESPHIALWGWLGFQRMMINDTFEISPTVSQPRGPERRVHEVHVLLCRMLLWWHG